MKFWDASALVPLLVEEQGSKPLLALLERDAGLLAWWRGPLDDINGRLNAASFVIAGPSLTSAALFAFALGVLAGALLRHTIVAMAATLTGFLAVRLGLEEYVRPHYRPPLVRRMKSATLSWMATSEGWCA